MKNYLYILCFFLSAFTVKAQKEITLESAISMAKKNSPDYEILKNRTESSYWQYNNYKSGFLPEIRLDATIPSYSNAITRITNDEGNDIFVSQNQALFDATLGINQNVPFLGGTFTLGTSFETIERFGDNSGTNYSVVPFTVSYFQNSIFYNPFKWDKKIEPLKYEESQKAFIEQMEDISITTSRRYFNLLKTQMQLKIARNCLSNQDTLYQIAKGRFKMGKIAENDLLQMELAQLNSQNSVTTLEINLKQASQDLARYLGLDTEDISLTIPEKLAVFDVNVDKAMQEVRENRKSVIEFRRKRLEAEKELARVKGTNRISLDVRANLGVSNQSEVFDDLYDNLNRQNGVTVRLGIPLFDWGVTKSKRKMAESNLNLVNTNVKQDEIAFEQEILLHTMNWANQRTFLATSEKAMEVANKRYDITKKRYILGKITITDLNLAQQEKDNALVTYLNSLEKFWTDYYTLRRLTLYDFQKDEKISLMEVLEFD